MATKKATVVKRPVKKRSFVPEVNLPPLVIASSKAKSTKKSVFKKQTKKPELIVVEEVNLQPKESLKLPYEASKEYIVVHRCNNCEHIPFAFNKLFTLYSILIMLLSVSVLIQVGTIDLNKLIAFVAPNAYASQGKQPAVRVMNPTQKTLYR